VSLAGKPAAPEVKTAVIAQAVDGLPLKSDGSPDFKKMTAAQKVAFSRRRIQNDLARSREDSPRRRTI
jgi:hypothetical protein